MRKTLINLFLFVLLNIGFVNSAVPTGYYDKANMKKNSTLKTAMHQIIRNHVFLDFDTNVSASYWWRQYYVKTDWNPEGYYWDMYSNDRYSTYKGGSYQNREHMMPRSWWGTSANYSSFDANGDLHNLYPANSLANEAKLNYPLGEVGITNFDNGVSKVGTNTVSGYGGTVFEPADEYKGDFARTYFYMVTCYEDYYSKWRGTAISSMLNKEIYPVFRPWALNMLLEWHRQDPVSQKEIDRNEAVYKIQNNRNPFIDFPDLAEYIWGNKMNEDFIVDGAVSGDPELISPSNGDMLDLGEVLINSTKVVPVVVKGKNMTGNMSVRLFNNADNIFSISTASISSSLINNESGYTLNISYTPKLEGENTANLVLMDAGIDGSISVTLKGKGVLNLGIDTEDNIPISNVYRNNNEIIFDNIEDGTLIEIYSITGQSVMSFRLIGDRITFNKTGIYLVKTNNRVFKLVF